MIKVDAREPEVIFELMKKEEVDFEDGGLLPVGDFIHEEKDICIERKTIADFIGSIRSGHLQKQLLQMQQYKHKYLFISGDIRQYVVNDPSWTAEHHAGSLISCSVRYDVKIIQFPNDMQLVKGVKKLCDKIDDGKVVNFLQTEAFKPKAEDLPFSLLMCFNGVGQKKAQKFLKKKEIQQEIKIFLEIMEKHGVYKHKNGQ